MRTEYKLYHRPSPRIGLAAVVGQFPTPGAAMLRTGYGNPADWRITPSGAWRLNEGLARSLSYGTGQPWVITEVQVPETDLECMQLAVDVALEFGQTDGDHHKMWVIDQMVRYLVGDRYEQVIAEYEAGEDGPDTYSWDEGIAP